MNAKEPFMPQISATVSWDPQNNVPKVSPNPLYVALANGATVIQWTCDSSVVNFQISGLDPNVFTSPATSGPVTVFTSTDRNQGSGSYNYTVTATHASGRTAKHDPRIVNGSGPI
jgi:hypothetical protein